MSANYISGEKKGSIFHITLNRPEKRNAIRFEMFIELADMVESLIADPEVRVIILKGAGPVFSAGLDLEAMAALVNRYKDDGCGAFIRSDVHKYQNFLTRLEVIEIPIICTMHSRAFGMSIEIALACDIRVMSEDCLWTMPEVRFGAICDLGGTSRLSRVIGAARAMEVLMTGDRFTAQQALQWGLVNHVFPAERMMDETEKLAARIAANAPLAVGATKNVIKRGNSLDLRAQLDIEGHQQSILLRSRDFSEAITAVMEKRPPEWKRE